MRRRIAKACRQKPRSIPQIEEALSARALKARVEKMASWGILMTAESTPDGKPMYALARGWEGDLDAATARNASAALVEQNFMVLAQPNLAPAAECLAREHADDLTWVGVVGKREGLVIGIGDGGETTVARIERTLRESGVECELKPVGNTASGDEVGPFLRGFSADDLETDV